MSDQDYDNNLEPEYIDVEDEIGAEQSKARQDLEKALVNVGEPKHNEASFITFFEATDPFGARQHFTFRSDNMDIANTIQIVIKAKKYLRSIGYTIGNVPMSASSAPRPTQQTAPPPPSDAELFDIDNVRNRNGQPTAPQAPTETFQVQTMKYVIKGDQDTLLVKGGKWSQYGWVVWPETVRQLYPDWPVINQDGSVMDQKQEYNVESYGIFADLIEYTPKGKDESKKKVVKLYKK